MGTNNKKRGADYYVLSHGMIRECQCCHNTTWLDGKPIPLEIHHVDGDRTNNSDENILILCPNCHYFTDNYKAKNRKKNCAEEYFCERCGKKLFGKTKTGMCKKCVGEVEAESSICSNKEELESSMKELKSYSKVAKKYGVSDKTIAKWCVRFGIK